MTAAIPAVSDFRFSHTLRVRWVEVDMQKIVFNGHYLMYFDTAVAEYWRAMAMPYEEAMHALGGDLYVVKATVEYKASAKYDDRLRVALKCDRVGKSSITFHGAIFCDGKLLVTGELIYVYADPATQTSKPVPQQLRALFDAFEAGEPMWQLRVGDWQSVGRAALPLREQVFVQEQGVPADLEHDALDAQVVHAVVRNRLDQIVATGRLLQPSPGVGQIGRMAVQRVLRGSGLGDAVLHALIETAKNRDDKELLLHAQVSALGFYAQAGFASSSEPYTEAGMAHQTMRMSLV